MKNTLHKTLCGIKVTLSFQAGPQDIHFSRFFEAFLFRDPTLAGFFSGNLTLQIVHRALGQSVIVPCQAFPINGEVKSTAGKFFRTSTASFYGDTNVVMKPNWVYSTASTCANTQERRQSFQGGDIKRYNDRLLPVVKTVLKPLTIPVRYDQNLTPLSSSGNEKSECALKIAHQKYLKRDNPAGLRHGVPGFKVCTILYAKVVC